MASIVGTLTDAGLKPLAGRVLRLRLRPEKVVATAGRLIVKEPVEAVLVDSTGKFTFSDVVASDTTIPPGRYTLTADWDVGRELNVVEHLYVPTGDWEFSDLLLQSGALLYPSIPFGFGPPPVVYPGLYYDVSDGEMYGNSTEVV